MVRRILKSVLVICVAVLMMICVTVPAFADDGQGQTIKVGVYGNSVYAYQDDNGVWRGVDIECLTNIAQREGLTLEFIDSVNDPDFLASLDNGTYDIVTDVVKTPARESRFLFSDATVASTNSTNVAVRADDGRWEYGNIEQVSQMRIGVVASFSNDAAFRDWCDKHAVTPQLVEYDSIGEMSDALAGGVIDGEVYGALYGDASAIRTILQIDPTNVYYAFRSNDVELKNKIDQGMSQILLEDPYYLSDLNNKYIIQRESASEPLTNTEKEYIAEHPVVTVAVIANDEPYYWKAKDGSDAGILPDYFALIAQQTGLQFKFVTYDTPDEEIAAVKNGEVDAIGLYANGIVLADQDGLLLTQSYATTNNVLLTHGGTSQADIHTIAVNQRSVDAVSSALARDFSGAQLVTYGTASDSLDALKSGSVDAIVCGFPSATWLMNQTNSSRYSVAPLSGASSEFCIAVNSDNRTLRGLLSKGVSTTKSSYDGVVTSNTLAKTDLKTFIERIPTFWLALAACVLFALVIGLIVALAQLRHRQRERVAVEAARVENERKETEIAALERNAEEKNRFFSNISHDMRTPLNAIIGFAEYARGADIPAEQKDAYFSKITTSGNLLLELINDTLTLSKINNGKLELTLAPIYTEDMGEKVTTPIRAAAAQKGITFAIDKSGYRPRMVLVDALSLEKIFLNLFSNSIKYTPTGGHVWTTVIDDPAGSSDPDLVFIIRDDGIGISEKFLPHLFEPFSTEGRAEAENTGTGLGLSIVKNLVDLMGGSISVESKIDKGTTFTVRLHLPEVDSDAIESPAQVNDGAFLSLKGSRVLLCEDNSINAEVAGLILRRMGMEYDVASNGEEGLALFKESPLGTYDAILMDVRMPVMDGLEATRAIRALERDDAATVPIIALSADAFEDDVRKHHEAGMNAHVSKPIDPKKLASTLEEQIGKRSDAS